MATFQVNVFYGDVPPTPTDGTVWINSTNGNVVVAQNGKWVEEGTALRGSNGSAGANPPGIFAGAGAPAFNANQGALYTRTDGSTAGSAHLYYNAATSGSAQWIGIG